MAQTNFRPGYVIKLNGDTLFGDVDYRGDLLMSKKCSFRAANEKVVVDFTPSEISSYRFINGKYFVAKNVKNSTYYLEFLINGKINIYYLRDEAGEYYFIEKEGLDIVEIPYEEKVKYVDNVPYLVESTKHIGFLKVYMQDATNLNSEIESIKKPDHNSLIHLAEDYHNAVCKDESCIIYEKKIPLISIHPQMEIGVVNYEDIRDLHDKFYLTGGIVAHFWLPRSNEKLFFKTGILISEILIAQGKELLYKIPLQVEYQYPSGIVRPKLSFGVNLYSPFYQSAAFGGGVNIKMFKSLFLVIDVETDFRTAQFPLWPKQLLSYSLLTGLYYSF